ncbi:MAG TPA: protein kinase [Streptosporangiaceae bacterium]
MDHLRESSVVGGRFRLIEPAGTGRPAGVWRAADLASGQDVAVKVLGTFPAVDTAAQARFRVVAQTVAQLSAPGLAGVREFGEAALDGGRTVPYLVRDLVSGPTLDERLSQGALPAGEALRVVAEVAEALAEAHRAGVAHGHLVPGNIVLGPDHVKVTDAGLWPLRPRPAGDPVPGGLGYAAPELTRGPPTPAADMYALGVVFVACLAGIAPGGPRTPGEGPAGDDVAGAGWAGAGLAGTGAGGPPAGAPLDPVPAGLAALWAACLGPNPQDRPSAAHAAVMSRQLLPGSGTSAGATRAGWVPAPRTEPTAAELAAAGPASQVPGSAGPGSGSRPGHPGPGGLAGRRGWRPPARGRRRPVLASRVTAAATAAAAAVAVVLVALLASSPGPRPGSPASAATETQAKTTVAAQPSTSGRGPSPEATSPVLASSPAPSPAVSSAVPLSPRAALDQLSLTIHHDVAAGQVRPDVGVDFGNLIAPVQADLASGQPAPVAQLAATLRAKLWTRVSEGAVTVTAATVLNTELSALARSAGPAG